MCGILGLIHYDKLAPTYMKAKMFRKATTDLLKASQIRGSDATGALMVTDKKASLFKTNLPANKFVGTPGYSKVLKDLNRSNSFRAMIGHVRHKTKGHQKFNINNHPIKANRIVGVHNGIIANDDSLFDKYAADLHRAGRVDSEIIFRLIDLHRKENKTLIDSVKLTCEEMIGSYACAFIDLHNLGYVTLFSNGGNIHISIYKDLKAIAFASTASILSNALKNNSILDPAHVTQRLSIFDEGVRINTHTGKVLKFELGKKKLPSTIPILPPRIRGICSLDSVGYATDGCNRLCDNCPHYLKEN
jgi:glucosamine 6-phosphate synthetase-like amidotransferase/phosphosugar isomerase protein